MTYIYTIPNNSTGLDRIIIDIAAQVPILIPMFMLFTFFLVFLGGISRQKAKTINPDYPMWAVIASICVFLEALFLSVNTGIIKLDWLVIVTVLTIFSGVWFFLDRRTSEL